MAVREVWYSGGCSGAEGKLYINGYELLMLSNKDNNSNKDKPMNSFKDGVQTASDQIWELYFYFILYILAAADKTKRGVEKKKYSVNFLKISIPSRSAVDKHIDRGGNRDKQWKIEGTQFQNTGLPQTYFIYFLWEMYRCQ